MSFFDSITPDFSNPSDMALFGALGNVLSVGSAPRYDPRGMGVTGGSPLNALLALGGAGMQGATAGATGAQQYQKENIGNEMGQLGLERQQVMQPMQLSMMRNMMGGGAPGSLAGGVIQPGQSNGGQMTVGDQQFAQAYQLAMMSGDMGKAAAVLQSWAEHNPQLAGAIKGAQEENSVHETPNGPMYGTQGLPGASFGSPAPVQMGMQPSIAPVQGPQAIPPINASQLQLPPAPGQIAGNPFQPAASTSKNMNFNPFSKVSTEAASKEATDKAANMADAEKTYNVMMSNFPNMQQRIGDMTQANKISSFGPFRNDAEGEGVGTKVADMIGGPTAKANALLQQRASQGVLPELGPSLAQAGIKGNKFLETLANSANNIDLSKGIEGRQTQMDGLMKAYIQNMKSAHDQISGLGGNPSPLPPPVIAQAVKYGVMTRSEAEKYLQENHGMK